MMKQIKGENVFQTNFEKNLYCRLLLNVKHREVR